MSWCNVQCLSNWTGGEGSCRLLRSQTKAKKLYVHSHWLYSVRHEYATGKKNSGHA